MFDRLVALIDAINDWLGRLVSFGVIPIAALVLFEVFCRYLFNSPTVWANELTQMLFGAYVILSGGYIMRWGGHVNVDILYSRLTGKTRAKFRTPELADFNQIPIYRSSANLSLDNATRSHLGARIKIGPHRPIFG